MKRSTKAILATAAVAAVGTTIVIAMRKPKAPPGPASVSDIPPALPGAVDFNLPEGWTVYGWYTYQGNSNAKLWIRVDKGPESGTVLVDLPWRWTIFPDLPGAAGYVPIATGEDSWTNLFGRASEAYVEYDDARMAQLVARAAADQIDAMYPEAA